METGRIITQLRIKANLTQEQLAEKLFVSRELVSKWETGSRLPGYSVIQTLSEIFNVSPDSILDRNDMILNDLSECFDNYDIKNEDSIIEILNSFIETLNDREKCVFLRRYYFFEDISVISINYEISENYVRTILTRTRKKLKKHLEVLYG